MLRHPGIGQNESGLLLILQGIVMEKSPYSEHVYVEAAYQQGWIDKTSRALFYRVGNTTSASPQLGMHRISGLF